MAFFGNRNVANTPNARYNKSIHNLLLVVIFSAINIVMLVTNAGSYWLFSAIIPYFVVDYGMYWCGMYPAEYYADTPIEFMDKSFFIVTVVIAVVMILAYLVCWILALKGKVGALICALVFFVIDTMGMFYLYGFSMDSIMDIVFHVWIIVSLVIGIVVYYKAKKGSITVYEPSSNEINGVENANVQSPSLNEFDENATVRTSATLNGVEVSNTDEGTDVTG